MFLVRLKLLMTAIFWGGTFIAGRIVAKNMDPFAAAFLRFFISSFFLFFIVLKIEKKFVRIGFREMLSLAFLGLTGIFLYNVFFFSGLHHISAGRASLIIANNPIFISLFSALIYKEKLSWKRLMGILLSVSGAIVVISNGQISQIWRGGFGVGELFILLCVASWVAYSLVGKKVMTTLSPLMAVAYSNFAGTLFLFFPAVWRGMFSAVPNYNGAEWSSLIYLGIFGTVLGFLWYYEGIQKIGPMRASIFINFVPISAVVMAWFFLKEPITLSLLTGLCLVSGGVYFTNQRVRGETGSHRQSIFSANSRC